MAYYAYKRVCNEIPNHDEYVEKFEKEYGREFEGDCDYDGDYWILTSMYIDDLKSEIAALKGR